ncbi:MAG: hypothetical protein AAFQ66_12520 [Pseudomonadota bacterium]
MKILILGASYGSLLSTKLLMAGHDVTLTCLPEEADLINAEGTVVRLTLRGEETPRLLKSGDQPGKLSALTPADANPAEYDLVALAMQEPQYRAPEVCDLLNRIATARKPCMSIMNMPPLPYLKRIAGISATDLTDCYTDASVWNAFEPGLVTLCSPDPQAFRPPEEKLNFLHVGLPTNFKAAAFDDPDHTALLKSLEDDIAAVRLDGKDVPVKLRVHDSLFVPLAKWSMLLTGNYRCILESGARAIKEAVHTDGTESAAIYEWVNELARKLGADQADQVPFEKYAAAAENLLKPSSAARAVEAGAPYIERVDKVVKTIAETLDMQMDAVDNIVSTVNARLAANQAKT